MARRPSSSDVLHQIEAPDRFVLELETVPDAEADIAGLSVRAVSIMADHDRSEWDAMLAPDVHRTMKHLDRRQLLDMPMWHWMTTHPMRAFVVARWLRSSDPARGEGLTRSEVDRFIGGNSLVGVARNALSRLYWSADALVRGDDYSFVAPMLMNQDLFVGVFERRLGLHPPAAQACALVLAGVEEDERREVLARLNFVLATSVLEELDEPTLSTWLARTLDSVRSEGDQATA